LAKVGSHNFIKVGSVQENMRILSDKLNERFKKLGHAFRFFDLNSTGKISLQEFSFGIDQLQVKLTTNQVQELFKRIDLDGDGFLSY
jgi:Ca2+-binding EF-hand superfamily protein